ncbi:hypothetical protein APR09_001346 [Nocardia amikacinitolerans]|nr:hypothetical protein [Nocardia amikacinitolerans]
MDLADIASLRGVHNSIPRNPPRSSRGNSAHTRARAIDASETAAPSEILYRAAVSGPSASAAKAVDRVAPLGNAPSLINQSIESPWVSAK